MTLTEQRAETQSALRNGEVVVIDSQGQRQIRQPGAGLMTAERLDLLRPVLFQELDPQTYQRPYDAEVSALKRGELPLEKMTPAYAFAMICAELKATRTTVRTFADEIGLAKLWSRELDKLTDAFDLPRNHFSIDTGGPILHVHPLEEAGKTTGPNNRPMQFEMLRIGEDSRIVDVGRGFEAILPTHFQGSAYNTPAHPEMDSSLAARYAIPSIQIGQYVRVGGAFNLQGSEKLVLHDNCWIGQNAYFILQEHEADKPSQLSRVRQYTSFPGMEVGSWAWVAKDAKVLYRTQYVGRGAVIAAETKVNTWVSDYSLVTGDGHNTFYPLKSFVLERLGINQTQDVLALDWDKVEALFRNEYRDWRNAGQAPDKNIDDAIATLRENRNARVLFIGGKNGANILRAASPDGGKNPLRRIDVMTTDQSEQAFIMQALNGLRNLNTRFRAVDKLSEIPINHFYEDPLYDLVVVEASASLCRGGSKEACKIFDEAARLVKPDGRVVGTIHGMYESSEQLDLPEYVTEGEASRDTGDTIAVHVQQIANRGH